MKKLQDSHILIVHSTPYNRKMLSGILQLMGVKNIQNAFEASDAMAITQTEKFDVIIAEMTTGVSDAVALSKQLRQDRNNENHLTPVLAIASNEATHIIEDARDAGVTDLLKSPYSADNIAERVMYAINTPVQEQIDDVSQATPIEPAQIEHATQKEGKEEDKDEWPNPEESNALTNMLMEHYLRHHEIILTKLRFAQGATKQSIEEIRNMHEKIRESKGSQESELNDFGDMWERIIKMFMQGGLSEKALFDIEKIVTQIPDDIKQHYNDLTSKDKDFLSRVESLSKSGYEKAKKRILNLQEEPNPLTGKTATDYQAAVSKEKVGSNNSGTVKAIVYDPVEQKMIFKSYHDKKDN